MSFEQAEQIIELLKIMVVHLTALIVIAGMIFGSLLYDARKG